MEGCNLRDVPNLQLLLGLAKCFCVHFASPFVARGGEQEKRGQPDWRRVPSSSELPLRA